MASEISLFGKLAVTKGTLSVNKQTSKTADLTGTKFVGGVQIIGTATAGEQLSMNDVTTAGTYHFCNTDATNYVEVGIQNGGTFYPLIKLKPGEVSIGRLSITSVYARANTSAVNLDYTVFED